MKGGGIFWYVIAGEGQSGSLKEEIFVMKLGFFSGLKVSVGSE